MKHRLGILVSHPIQYFSPWFRFLANRLDLEVFYAHRQEGKGQAEAGFGIEFDWDVPLLNGYQYRWLSNVAARPNVNSFGGCDTPEIYDVLKNGMFDAFLIFGWNRKSAIQAIRACLRKKIPVLMRGDSQLLNRNWARRVAKYFPYRFFLPRLNGHLYVGKRNKAYLKHYGVSEEQLFFVPHFVDNSYFADQSRNAEMKGVTTRIRTELGIPRDAFVFLYVGKLIPGKRPDDFLQACLKIFNEPGASKIHAIVAGDGPLRNSLELSARPWAPKIHFVGFLNQSRLPAYYKASNALVLPGEESWGLVVNEAFACGIPAIVSDAAGAAPDMIEEGRTGFSYPHGNLEKLTSRMSAIKTLWENKAPEMSHALAERIIQYSIDEATEGLVGALNAVSSKPYHL